MNDYPIVVKSYQLTLWYLKKIEKLPKNHRFSLGEKVQNGCLELLMILTEAIYSKEKRKLLTQANQHIEKLRLLSRLMADLGLISTDNKRYILSVLQEIGAMAGGWMKQLG